MQLFPSKPILSTALCLLVLSSSAIAADEKKNKNRLRGRVVEEISPPSHNETGAGEEDSHHRHGLTMDVLEPPAYHNDTRSLSVHGNENIVIHEGLWGEWKDWKDIDSNGMYACGAELRSEDRQGAGDDSAANGLRLKYCGLSDWRIQKQQEIWTGDWGKWKKMVMCPHGKYIGAATVRFEDRQGGGDDSALNGLAIWCVNENWRNGEVKIVYNGEWGGWKDWSYKVNKLVKGARVRYEDKRGGGDDSAMNGIEFNVEKPNYGVSRSQITGEWVPVVSGPQGQFSHKIIESTETTKATSLTKEESYGFEQSISAGFKIKAIDFSGSVTASQSRRTARAMHNSLRVYKGTETTFGCPSSDSPTGYYTMWQFRMSQPSDSSGIGFKSDTKHIRCTPSQRQPPRCTLGSCRDTFCQHCFE